MTEVVRPVHHAKCIACMYLVTHCCTKYIADVRRREE